MRIRNKHAKIGWAAIFIYVAAFDIWAIKTDRPTLSKEFGEAMASPSGKIIGIGMWAILTNHLLLSKWTKKIDPIQIGANRLRKRWNK